MSTPKPCAKCGGAEILEGRPIGRQYLRIHPGLASRFFAILFMRDATDLSAEVCARCGHVELYAIDPKKLAGAR